MTLAARSAEITNIREFLTKSGVAARPAGNGAIIFELPQSLRQSIELATYLYLVKYLPPGQEPARELDSLVTQLESLKDKLVDVTPNGMVVPKHHTSLEFNLYAREVFRIVSEVLGFTAANARPVLFYDTPPNIRIKYSQPLEANLKREGASELPHLDVWSNTSSQSFTLHLPLAGDVTNNHVKVFDLPDEFEEEFLTRRTYQEGQQVASRYRRLNDFAMLGEAVLMDASCIHQTFRGNNAGARISTDFAFTPVRRFELPAMPDADNAVVLLKSSDDFGRIPEVCARDLGVTGFLRPVNPSGIYQESGRTKHPGGVEATTLS